MPKKASPSPPGAEDRRDQVAQATWRVIARDGLDRTSMRAIAQELGCTTGVLTHYFRDKDALLDFALSSIVSQLRLATDGADIKDLGVVRDLLDQILPTDASTKTWWKVWLSFTVAVMANPRQAANHAKLYSDLRAFWTLVFARLRERGRLPASVDPALEAEMLLCLVDGIGVHALISPRTLTAKRQLEIVDAYLARLARG